MKYFIAKIYIEARNESEARRLLDQHLKDSDGISDCSMHCTEHDPTIPHMSVWTNEEESNEMNDCTDGCR